MANKDETKSPPAAEHDEPGLDKDSPEANSEEEDEEKPVAEELGEDCVAFLRSTTVGQSSGPSADCPHCPSSNAAPDALKFSSFKIVRYLPAGDSCEVDVTISATFRPGLSGPITGGLTKWIAPEQRAQVARGETPQGEQVYPVKITYRRTATGWRPVEFN